MILSYFVIIITIRVDSNHPNEDLDITERVLNNRVVRVTNNRPVPEPCLLGLCHVLSFHLAAQSAGTGSLYEVLTRNEYTPYRSVCAKHSFAPRQSPERAYQLGMICF